MHVQHKDSNLPAVDALELSFIEKRLEPKRNGKKKDGSRAVCRCVLGRKNCTASPGEGNGNQATLPTMYSYGKEPLWVTMRSKIEEKPRS